MKYTHENIEKVAEEIVESMELDDLCTYVYEDLIYLMEGCEDTFQLNVESLDWNENPPE